MWERRTLQATTMQNGSAAGREMLLLLTGIAGIVLGAASAVMMLIQGNIVPPDGEWMKPVTFDSAVGLFIVTTAFLLPLAGFTSGRRILFRRVLAFTVWYWYGMETIQTYRGVDPRFGDGPFLTDELPGILFGVSSVWFIALHVMLLVKFFSRTKLADRPALTLGIRYGFAVVMLGFAAGLWMVALQDRMTGAGGNILSIHFLGFHALQALPITGWLLEKARLEQARVRWLIHVAGCSWVAAVLCAAAQTGMGVSPMQPTLFSAIGAAGLLACLAIAFYGLASYRKARAGAGQAIPPMAPAERQLSRP